MVRKDRRSSVKALGLVLLALVVVYAALSPRLARMREEAARINRELDEGERSNDSPADRIGQLRSALAQDPNNAGYRLELASRLHDAARFKEAEVEALAAVRLRPGQAPPLLLLAEIEHRAKHYDLAIAAYRSLLRISPNHADASAGLAWLYISLGWTREACEMLEVASKAHPKEPRISVALSLTYLQQGQLAKAESILGEIRRDHLREVDLWAPMVDVYLKTKRPAEAVRIATEALAIKPGDARLLNGLGQARYDSGDLQGAVEAFQKVVAIDKDNLLAHHRIALANKKMGKPQDAIREFEIVYKLSPDFEQTRQLLGQLYFQNGRSADGKKLIDEAAAVTAVNQRQAKAGYLLLHQAKSPNAHYQMALSYRELKDPAHMIVELTRTLELAPNHKEAQKLLEEALLQRSRSEAS